MVVRPVLSVAHGGVKVTLFIVTLALYRYIFASALLAAIAVKINSSRKIEGSVKMA